VWQETPQNLAICPKLGSVSGIWALYGTGTVSLP